MHSMQRTLLAIDGIVNLLLGMLLLLFPAGLLELIGAPPTSTLFYTSILGAVIFGIGIALFVELFGGLSGFRGLGLAGAIAINLCGGGVLLGWLLVGTLDIPLRGRIIGWVVALVVLGIGAVEIATRSWSHDEQGT